jgi:alpha-glucoside transport system permease protein
MAARTSPRKKLSRFLVEGTLILICLLWILPTLGILVTSVRSSKDIFSSGWWTVLPHRTWVETGEFRLDETADVDGLMTVGNVTATFEQFRQGVQDGDQRYVWFGNKRTRLLKVEERQWQWFYDGYTTENYQNVLVGREIRFQDASGAEIVRQGSNLSGAFLNSIAVTIPATIIPILIASFAAYAFAWMNFPGRKVLFIVVVALLVVPLQIALIPILQDYTRLGLTGTYLAMWLAHTGFGLPLAVYLLFNYIGTLPRETLEAAFIDGASHFTIFFRLILPLSVPALASFAIFQFLWVWNDYLVALVFLGDQNRVLTYALAAMVGEKGQDWHLLTAGAFVSMILPLTVFFALQRYFVRGLMAGSVKG